jgi:predicted DNA-binding protein (MmcQ/YjbR family)
VPRRSDAKWERLRKLAVGLPEAWEDHPWEEVVAKVGKKVFVFLGRPTTLDPQSVTVKLTESHNHALSIPGAAPAGYGLGKAGWVTLPIRAVDEELVADWIEESYRNVAPKKLAAQLDAHRRL